MSVTTWHIHNPEHLEPPTNGCENLKCFPPSPLKTLCDVFWMVTPCRIIHSVRNFGATYRLHLQGEWTRFTLVPQWPGAEFVHYRQKFQRLSNQNYEKGRQDRFGNAPMWTESSTSQNRSKNSPYASAMSPVRLYSAILTSTQNGRSSRHCRLYQNRKFKFLQSTTTAWQNANFWGTDYTSKSSLPWHCASACLRAYPILSYKLHAGEYHHQSITQAMYYKHNSKARSRNHCCREESISITYSECVSVAVVIQNAKRMRRVIYSSVASTALPFPSTISHKRHGFRKRSYWTQNVCSDILYNFCLQQSLF